MKISASCLQPFNDSVETRTTAEILISNSIGCSAQELDRMIAIYLIHALICLTALLGNTAILITIWKMKMPSLRSASNILLSSLAVSDLAVGLVVQPLFLVLVLRRTYTVFVLYNTFGASFSIASFLTMTAIGVDRLFAFQLHLRYKAIVTPFRITWGAIFIWIFSGIFSSLWLWNQPSVFYGAFSVSSCWKFCCIFENLSHCPTPSEAASATTTAAAATGK